MLAAVGTAWSLTWPVLLFLVLITLVADLCADTRLFDVAAHLFARVAGGRAGPLLAAYSLLALLTTTFLSLDTTAVMLTPVGLALARELRLPPLPFAFATVWLANTASLLLPISNLTNLLAVERTHQSATDFLAHLWRPQLGVLAVVLLVLLVRFRLRGGYDVPRDLPEHDRVLVLVAGGVALGIGVATVAHVPAWLAAGVGLLVLAAVLGARRPTLVRPGRLLGLVPARITAASFLFFVLVEWVLATWPPTPFLHGDVSAAGAGALTANAINNLPAWLALSPVTDRAHWPALLVGVNAGGMVLLWGSLANVLWLGRCRRDGVEVSFGRFAREGLLVVPLAVLVGALLA